MVFELFTDEILEYSTTKDKKKLVADCERKYDAEVRRLKSAGCTLLRMTAVNIYMTAIYDLAELYDRADALFAQNLAGLKNDRISYVEVCLLRAESLVVHKRLDVCKSLLESILDKVPHCGEERKGRFSDLYNKCSNF